MGDAAAEAARGQKSCAEASGLGVGNRNTREQRQGRRTRRRQARQETARPRRPRFRVTSSGMAGAINSNSYDIRAQTSSAGSSAGGQPGEAGHNEMSLMRANSRRYLWKWKRRPDRTQPFIVSADRLSVCFHPVCSDSTVACRSVEPIKRNGNYYYWEIHVKEKTYGTSIMFGLCTKRQQMHMHDYHNLIGIDDCGWSLSHKGLIWHNGSSSQYTNPFPPDQPVTVGLLLDTLRGELSFFLEGRNLGVAFRGLESVQEELYPVVASTAKNTRMTLLGAYYGCRSLMERSCFSLLKGVHVKDPKALIDYLKREDLPKQLLEYVASAANVSLTAAQ